MGQWSKDGLLYVPRIRLKRILHPRPPTSKENEKLLMDHEEQENEHKAGSQLDGRGQLLLERVLYIHSSMQTKGISTPLK
jgi:hypothetical protein